MTAHGTYATFMGCPRYVGLGGPKRSCDRDRRKAESDPKRPSADSIPCEGDGAGSVGANSGPQPKKSATRRILARAMCASRGLGQLPIVLADQEASLFAQVLGHVPEHGHSRVGPQINGQIIDLTLRIQLLHPKTFHRMAISIAVEQLNEQLGRGDNGSVGRRALDFMRQARSEERRVGKEWR